MKRIAISALAIASIMAILSSAAQAGDKPADRVVAMYFHRTERCPTCRKMGSYTEEAVEKGFAKQVKRGLVEFHLVDYQDKKNAALAKGYKVSEPALVIARIKGNKVKEYKNLKDIWTKVRKKPEFIEYVLDNVKAYLK